MKFKVVNIKILNTDNVNCTTIKNLKNKLLGRTIRLKTLLKDVFQKEKSNEIKKQYISRGLPNSVGSEKDIYGGKSGKVVYFAEDIKKMAVMSEQEVKEYKQKLIIEGKYKIDYSPLNIKSE